MKKLYTILLLSISTTVNAQTIKNILFIGNSFTGANDLQGIVHQFFDGAAIPVYTFAYAPGGISVGDVSMGTDAHMNNPLVFDLIRSKDWDYVVLQDNQGRFSLDSAVFPATTASKVIEGHLKIRDSLHYYHPCAKMIWFSGWGFEDEDTVMINAITTNYRVLNDKAKDVIAPIGSAWKNSFKENRFFKLWSPDGAHPDLTGSYLTAAIIFGTITQKDVSANPFISSLPPADALYLKKIAQQTLIDPVIRLKSNLEGIKSLSLIVNKGILKAEAGYVSYQWYSGNTLIKTSADSLFSPSKIGKYRVWAKNSAGYWKKSCDVTVTTITGIKNINDINDAFEVYPNPAIDMLYIKGAEKGKTTRLLSVSGQQIFKGAIINPIEEISLKHLENGLYFLQLIDKSGNVSTRKILKQ